MGTKKATPCGAAWRLCGIQKTNPYFVETYNLWKKLSNNENVSIEVKKNPFCTVFRTSHTILNELHGLLQVVGLGW